MTRGLKAGQLVLVLLSSLGLLRGQNADSEEFIFPIVASGFVGPVVGGSDWGPRLENTITFVNLSEETITGIFRHFSNDGKPGPLLQIQVGRRPSSFSSYFAALIPPTIPSQFDGWARLTLPFGAKLFAEIEVVFFRSPNPPTSAHLQAIKPAREFRVTFVNRAGMGGRRFAIAIVNPSAATTATVWLDYDRSGVGFVGYLPCPSFPVTLQVLPLNRFSKFFDQICGETIGSGGAFPPATGSLRIASSVPIAIAILEVFSDGTFSTMLARPVGP